MREMEDRRWERWRTDERDGGQKMREMEDREMREMEDRRWERWRTEDERDGGQMMREMEDREMREMEDRWERWRTDDENNKEKPYNSLTPKTTVLATKPEIPVHPHPIASHTWILKHIPVRPYTLPLFQKQEAIWNRSKVHNMFRQTQQKNLLARSPTTTISV